METGTAATINKVYAILTWLGAFVGFMMAIVLFMAGTLGGTLGLSAEESSLLMGVGVIGGVFVLALAVFSIFLGIAIWRRRNWARIVAIILSALSVLYGIVMIFGAPAIGIFQILVNGFFLWFYASEPSVKELFTAPVAPLQTATPRVTPARTPPAPKARAVKRTKTRSRK